MAANNYFGFTHSGTQYAPTGATPYQTTQTGYAVAPTPAAATYTQRAAPAYETAYQAAAATHTTPGTYAAVPAGSTPTATTYDYGYAARSAQTAYDTTKTYYQQQTPAAATYSTTDYPGWHTTGGNYQNEITTAAAAAGKAQYSATYSTQTTRNSTQVQAQKAASYSTGTTAYTAQQAQPTSNYSSASYSTPPISQQPQPAQNKVVGATLHRNLSTVAEYTQPTQQRQVQTFTPKVKKTFHPQTSVATSSVPGTTPGTGATSNVTAVTSYTGTTPQTYSATSTAAAAAAAAAATNSYTQQNYTPATPTQTAATKPKAAATTYSGYDAALYNAATMYVAQQATPSQTANTSTIKTTPGGWQGYKKNIGGMMKPVRQKLPPKPQQLHYCDVCKISCAGPQTYREHLEGQKHKKKEASMKAGTAPSVPRGANALRCELCDVTCTGTDAYTAHIRGAKHQKVVKLHTKLGKPIPAADPKAAAAAAAAAASGTKTTETGGSVTTPKINFVASGNLGTVKTTSSTSTAGATTTSNGTGTGTGTANAGQASPTNKTDDGKNENKMEGVEITPENDITPVGQEYIEEITNDEGKVISFNCKLCECRFNDPNAKGMHMKGRRHRLQFKKKVNPDLVVDVKTSLRQRRLYEEKMRRQAMREEYYRRREEERASFWNDRMMEVEERLYWEERRRYEEELEYYEWYRRHAGPRAMGPPPPPPPYGPPVGPPMMPPAPLAPPNHPGRAQQPFFPSGPPMPPQGVIRRPDTSDDKHVIARHAAIYPKEAELVAVQKIVSHTEKALKLVSDHLTDQATKSANNTPGNQQTSGTKPGPAVNKPGTGPAAKSPMTGPQPKQQTPPTPLMNIKKEPATDRGPKSADQQNVNMRREKEDGRSGNLFSFQREKEEASAGRMLKGVMRVGVLAKGLLLAGDTATDLVMLCADKPTRSLLTKVAANLPAQLKIVAPDEAYTVIAKPDDAAIVVTSSGDTKMTVTVTLTSPVIREQLISPPAEGSGDGAGQAALKDPADILNKTKCLEALAALRHAKWFQARVTGLQSCVMVIRILRDLCQRNPTWAPLNPWAMELLAEKVISSAGGPMPPGEALRRIMEALASGILLGSGPGLLDPCEKEQTDATAGLTPQQREDITASAQHALRLMAFRQIHKVLGMDMLPAPKFSRNHRFTRKRRRDNSSGEGNDSEAGDGKKDKKDEGPVKMEIKMETDKK